MANTVFDPPLDPGIDCEHCDDPLAVVAVAERKPSFRLADYDPGYGYEWSHRHGSKDCRIVGGARPRSFDAPAEAVRRALAARADAEADAEDDAEFPNAAYRRLAGDIAYAGLPSWQQADDEELIARVIARRTAASTETK